MGNLPGGKVRAWNFPGWNFQCGENSVGEKGRGGIFMVGNFPGGINRGGTFRVEFSGGEIAGHRL